MGKKIIPQFLVAEGVSTWFIAISWIVVIFNIINTRFSFSVFVSGILALWFAKLCAGWASKIKGNPNVAYIIGFIFSLFGLLGYYIYYRIKSKRTEKKKNK